jgi:leucyl aminopeptidase (aminopeptidase T)
MRSKHQAVAAGVLALAALAPLLPADDAPRAGKERDLDGLAAKLVTQSARVGEGELVYITGAPKDAEALEDLAVHVRKQGAFPLLALTSDRLSRRLYDDVPAKFDSQTPAWDLKMAGLVDAEFLIDSADEAALAGVPPERVAAQTKAEQPVFAEMRKRNVRLVTLGNGLYPTPSRAKQFGLREAELADLFWDGINVDYDQLHAAGERLKKALADGKEIRLTNPNGTDLKASIQKRPVMVSDGVISDDKRKEGGAACWTYLPAGEVYVSTAEGTAEGRVIVDRLFYKGKEVHDLILGVKGGKVVSLEAKSGAEELQADFKVAAEGKDRCGVIDIGINPNVRPPAGGKVLTYMQAGMVSLSFGNNTWAGGDDNTPFGVGCFLPGSTLAVDGKAVVEKGELKP